jgi:polyisoprenoid-binding protein YceI
MSSTTSRSTRAAVRLGLTAALTLGSVAVIAQPGYSVAKAKAGAACTKAGQKSGTLTCTRSKGKLVWVGRTAATTTKPGSKATTPATPAADGIEGTWKVGKDSVVGYRVKEILQGQPTEGVGRTSAITGSMTIAGTNVTAVEITADLTELKSDSTRRDGAIRTRFLESDKFPTATLKLKAPIALGSVPADKAEVKQTATIDLTLHGVTKEVKVDVSARRNGPNIEVLGATKIVFADFGIATPEVPGFVSTDPDGLLEFLVVFTR